MSALSELEEAVSVYAAGAAERLRMQDGVAGTITVFIMTNRFQTEHPQDVSSATISFLSGTNDTRILVQHALVLLRRIFRNGNRYVKAGVMLDAIEPRNKAQLGLFDSKREQSVRKMQAVDAANQRYGSGSVQVGSCGKRQQWRMKRRLLSQRYTTRWDELLRVRA